MKKYKKSIVFLAIFFAFIAILLIIQTYAKYISSANGETAISIAKWNIKVNDKSIKTDTNISSTIAPVFPGNENIASNILAPTAEGYFDLNFDFSDADVSFKYTITSTIAESSPVKDFVIVGYSIDNGKRIDFDDNNNSITEDILLSSNIKNRTIRIFLKWIDDESASMSNEEDTIATNSSTPAICNVNINFTQIV